VVMICRGMVDPPVARRNRRQSVPDPDENLCQHDASPRVALDSRSLHVLKLGRIGVDLRYEGGVGCVEPLLVAGPRSRHHSGVGHV
jgi:hypothetical protein